ncbi:MAG: acetyl-CoA carboxylase biotin carboxyl carrier protein [Thermoguttaceae bacterium]|jgi:acetyl-CoA carboxylase biotin carboxyl carrier protein
MAEKKDDVFDLNGIRSLVELMKENNVIELELEQGGSRLLLQRGSDKSSVAVVAAPSEPVAPVVQVAPASDAPAAPAQDKDPDYIEIIKAPMVGVFYDSPSPEAAPFVKVGDVIDPKKTVCIIEAMKVFNDIPADISGKIVEIVAKSGDPVEYGTPLFKVDVR